MSYYRLFYHFFGGQRTHPLILPEFEASCTCKARKIEFDGIVHAIGGTEDHVHVAVTVPPKHSLSDSSARSKAVVHIS